MYVLGAAGVVRFQFMNAQEFNERDWTPQIKNLEKGFAGRGQQERKRADGVNTTITGGLIGDLDPVRYAKRETPVHRTMVNMAAAGYTNREIAAFTGYNKTTVATAIKQPHAREYLINEAKKTVQDELRTLLESQALPSIQKLVQVRDNEKSKGSDVIAASNSILDRFLGKPTQPIVTDAKPVEQMTEDELKSRTNALLTRFGSFEGVSKQTGS